MRLLDHSDATTQWLSLNVNLRNSVQPSETSNTEASMVVRSPSRPEGETIRVDKQRLDDLINQIGELVIGASMVEQEVSERANGIHLVRSTRLSVICKNSASV